MFFGFGSDDECFAACRGNAWGERLEGGEVREAEGTPVAAEIWVLLVRKGEKEGRGDEQTIKRNLEEERRVVYFSIRSCMPILEVAIQEGSMGFYIFENVDA